MLLFVCLFAHLHFCLHVCLSDLVKVRASLSSVTLAGLKNALWNIREHIGIAYRHIRRVAAFKA